MIGPQEDQGCPEWDDEMKAVVEKHEGHMHRVVSGISGGLPSIIHCPKAMFEEALKHAFEGGLEAITKDLR